jgi:hypothetical protein
MLTVRREGHAMSLHTLTRRRTIGAVTATALTMPMLVAVPAQAGPCQVVEKTASCNKTVHTPGTRGGGTSGGGGDSGPWKPPAPEGLTPDEAQGVVDLPGAAAPEPAPPTTADLVAQARASADFPTPTVNTAPADKTYVGLRTALWVDGWQDVPTTPINVAGQSISLIAKPRSVTWKMGEKAGGGEATFDCPDAGSRDGKTCNYTYRHSSASEPGGTYMISATITWDVSWTCTGANCDSPGGVLPPASFPSGNTPLTVGEIQTNTGQ